MEEAGKDWMMIRMVGGWMFLLVPVHPGIPGQKAVKRLLLFHRVLYKHFEWYFVMKTFKVAVITNIPNTQILSSSYNGHYISHWDEVSRRVWSRDVVSRVSVLAQSGHLHVSSRLCLEFPCLVMSHVSWLRLSQAQLNAYYGRLV